MTGTHSAGIPTIFVTVLMLFLCHPQQAVARDYHMDGLSITIGLDHAGRMEVREDRSFTFEGRFSEVYRTFPLNGEASFENIKVFEGEAQYPRANTRAPGTIRLIRNNSHQELQIFFDAADTTRVFSIRYTVSGALNKYEDAALLYYQLISDQWTKPIRNIRAQVIPPEPLNETGPAHWIHGSLDAESLILEGGIVDVSLDHLPANHYLEVRALYPPDIFPGLPRREGLIRQTVKDEAAALAEEANRQRQEAMARRERQEARHQTGQHIAIPLALLFIVLWIYLFNKYGRRPGLREKPGTFSSLPGKVPPALVNYLMHSSHISGSAITATLFHLASRGFVRITEKNKKSLFGKKGKTDIQFVLEQTHFEKHASTLTPYEGDLLRFLFVDLAETKGRIDLKRIRKKPGKIQAFFRKWRKSVRKEAQKHNWFDKKSRKGQIIGLVAGFLAFIGCLILSSLFGIWMFIPAGAALVLAIASVFIFHRTEEGEKAYRQWKSLKQHLRRFHFESETKTLDAGTVNDYLVYGLALGLGSGYFKKLSRGLEQSGHLGYLPWIVLHQSSMGTIGKTINQIITVTSTTISSASGMGGGGTMGGGGGVASGGGGAR